MITILACNAAITAGLFFLLWLVSLWRRDASIVDPCWGSGFVVVAWSTWWQVGCPTGWPLALVALVTLWGLRLSLFLAWRNHGKGEDYRYREMRDYHGARFAWVSLYTVFGLQALLLWFISFPIQFGVGRFESHATTPWLASIGIVLWSVGVFFEAVGDWQLATFKRQPRQAGEVLDRGLWRYTRHPNYFGDFCVWWGIFLIAAAGGAWGTLASPVIMSVLLLKVSGVALLEKSIVDRRPAYADYMARTNAFFPGPRRPSRRSAAD